MDADDKFKHKSEDIKGRAKEAAGSATDDDELKREGQVDQASAAFKQKADKAKDSASRAADKLTGQDD